MIAGAAIAIAGVMLCGWGLRAADGGERPLDLVGAIKAALGALTFASGIAALVAPGFIG